MRTVRGVRLQTHHLASARFDHKGLGKANRLTSRQHMRGGCFNRGSLAIFGSQKMNDREA